VPGAGTVPGSAADALASGLSMNPGGWLFWPGATGLELHLAVGSRAASSAWAGRGR
jgi:hypothetical protein